MLLCHVNVRKWAPLLQEHKGGERPGTEPGPGKRGREANRDRPERGKGEGVPEPPALLKKTKKGGKLPEPPVPRLGSLGSFTFKHGTAKVLQIYTLPLLLPNNH